MSTENKDLDFGKRAEKYDAGFEGKFSRKFYAALLSQVKPAPGMAILDVGCGTGYLLSEMARLAPIDGFGIDVEREMIAVAKRVCPDMSIQLSSCDDTPFEASSFDIITACMAFHHFADKAAFLREAFRLLKPDGLLYIADPRFPAVVRKPLNLFFRARKINGTFFTAEEIAAQGAPYGLEKHSVLTRGYVLVVGFKKGRAA